MKSVFLYLGLMLTIACAVVNCAAFKRIEPAIAPACDVITALTDDERVDAVCATVEELADLADMIKLRRAGGPDAGRTFSVVGCKIIPKTTTCATNAELAPAIRTILARRKDGGTAMRVNPIPETKVSGKRLGRHVEHDPRSRAFSVIAASTTPLRSVAWQRHTPAFQQGDIGSCTGNAIVGACMTGPLYRPGMLFDERDAVSVYESATKLDNIPGHYPPDDTGSSGLAVCKVAKLRGWISGYHHAFTLHQALVALASGPIIVGSNWYEGMDQPNVNHELQISGDVRGGHEYEILAIDVPSRRVRMINSWGQDWGDHGYAVMSFDMLGRLLSEDGDARAPFKI